MQVVILAGGFGTRLAEETDLIPKPMVKIGDDPILLHIMKYYAAFGHTEFLIALGYKAHLVFNYFESRDYFKHLGWTVKLVDTGLETSTGGRVKRLANLLDNEFMLTYGDGLSNVNLNTLVAHHRHHEKIATVTAVHPPARFGSLVIRDNFVVEFAEKDPKDTGWINGGFFVLSKRVCEYLPDNLTPFEGEPMIKLVQSKQLVAFQHDGWWQPMDTLRDKRILEELWSTGGAPWTL